MELTARVVECLNSYSDAQLDRVTAQASVFFDRRWFRMLDAIDLAPLVRGDLRLRYIVVSRGTEPVAICPFVITESETIYFFYSLKKFFFTSWQSELLRLDPTRAGFIRWISGIVAGYLGFARATGAGTSGWVLAVSPLSHRGDIALGTMSGAEEDQARHLVIDTLQDVAKDGNLPLCFFGVQEDKSKLRQALAEQEFAELFLVYDNLLPVRAGSFSEYLGRFRSDARRLFQREIRQAGEAGVRFETTSSLEQISDRLETLYDATYSKYGDEHFHHPASFWAALERYVAPHAEALIAEHASKVVGFSLLLNKNSDLWFYRVGRSYAGGLGEAPVYFNLAFYEPVKRAIALGAKRLWLGSGAWEAKRRRGAGGHALYSYLWFPRRWARWVLMPYLETFTRISQHQMAAATQPSTYLKSARLDARHSSLHPSAFPAPSAFQYHRNIECPTRRSARDARLHQ